MDFHVSHFHATPEGVFFWNATSIWWWTPTAYKDGARSAFTMDGKKYYWGWLSNFQALTDVGGKRD